MKHLFLILTIVILSSVMANAQDKNTASVGIDQNAVKQSASQPATPHYYFKNKRLIKCSCTQWSDQTENVKLANGTIVTNKGEVATHHWTKIEKLKEGECVDANGNIIDHKLADSEIANKK